jgi:rubrerythrin
MEHLLEEAFRVAMQTEMNSLELYRKAAATMQGSGGRDVLERLAREESRIIEQIRSCSPCPPSATKDGAKEDGRCWAIAEGNEQPQRRLLNQLRVALEDKHGCIERYATYASAFRDPAVCKVFETALGMSRSLLQSIAEAYRQVDPSLQRPCANRRTKRAHIKAVNHPTPNKHSQLFISLLDSGRRSPF